MSLSAVLQNAQALTIEDSSVTICYERECKKAKQVMSTQFLYNKLAALLKANEGQELSFCDADEKTHTCLNDAINFEVQVGATQTTARILSATLVDSKDISKEKKQELLLDYQLEVGDTYPACQASQSVLLMETAGKIQIEKTDFKCQFTKSGQTGVEIAYRVNYIDFDNGVLGADYTVSVAKESNGQKEGYVLLNFKSAQSELEQECECTCTKEQNPPCKCAGEPEEVEEKEDVVLLKADEKVSLDVEDTQSEEMTQILQAGIPVVIEVEENVVEEDVPVGKVEASSNWGE